MEGREGEERGRERKLLRGAIKKFAHIMDAPALESQSSQIPPRVKHCAEELHELKDVDRKWFHLRHKHSRRRGTQ